MIQVVMTGCHRNFSKTVYIDFCHVLEFAMVKIKCRTFSLVQATSYHIIYNISHPHKNKLFVTKQKVSKKDLQKIFDPGKTFLIHTKNNWTKEKFLHAPAKKKEKLIQAKNLTHPKKFQPKQKYWPSKYFRSTLLM